MKINKKFVRDDREGYNLKKHTFKELCEWADCKRIPQHVVYAITYSETDNFKKRYAYYERSFSNDRFSNPVNFLSDDEFYDILNDFNQYVACSKRNADLADYKLIKYTRAEAKAYYSTRDSITEDVLCFDIMKEYYAAWNHSDENKDVFDKNFFASYTYKDIYDLVVARTKMKHVHNYITPVELYLSLYNFFKSLSANKIPAYDELPISDFIPYFVNRYGEKEFERCKYVFAALPIDNHKGLVTTDELYKKYTRNVKNPIDEFEFDRVVRIFTKWLANN